MAKKKEAQEKAVDEAKMVEAPPAPPAPSETNGEAGNAESGQNNSPAPSGGVPEKGASNDAMQKVAEPAGKFGGKVLSYAAAKRAGLV